MILGIVLLVLGAGLAFLWPQEFFFALKGSLILGLFLVGVINVLIGLSKQKARRDFDRARHDETGDKDENKEAPVASVSKP